MPHGSELLSPQTLPGNAGQEGPELGGQGGSALLSLGKPAPLRPLHPRASQAALHPRRRPRPELTPSHRTPREGLHSALDKETVSLDGEPGRGGGGGRTQEKAGFPASRNRVLGRRSHTGARAQVCRGARRGVWFSSGPSKAGFESSRLPHPSQQPWRTPPQPSLCLQARSSDPGQRLGSPLRDWRGRGAPGCRPRGISLRMPRVRELGAWVAH